MKVCLDIQSAMGQRAGVGRYTRSLAEQLIAHRQNDEIYFFSFDFRNRGCPFSTGDVKLKRVTWCPGRLMRKSWNVLNFPPFNFLAGDADVYHFPNFIIPPLKRGRSIVTIHDVSFMAYPEFAEKRNLTWITSKIADTVQRADGIITDSAFSADEISERLKVNREKIFPIHLGISEYFMPPSHDSVAKMRRNFGLERPYLLTVGTVEPRKNLEFLISVFEQTTGFEGQLVLAGMRGWKYQPIIDRMRKSFRSKDIKYIEYVPDDVLPALYGGAELFVFPSLYEGFGFPPLEAMSCGTPVVASASGSLPEVLGDAALLVAECDAAVWAEKIKRLLERDESKKKMIEQGRRHAAAYTWSKTARATWEIYRRTAL